jgi:hypothetical protein
MSRETQPFIIWQAEGRDKALLNRAVTPMSFQKPAKDGISVNEASYEICN